MSRAILTAVLLTLTCVSLAWAGIDALYADRLAGLRDRLISRDFEPSALDRLFADDRIAIYPQIVTRTGKGVDYTGRAFGLLKKESIERGMRLLGDRDALFQQVERSFGVEKEIVVAVLRIETNFGRVMGKRPVLNSLLTLALVDNRRSAWAEEELCHLLRLADTLHLDPLDIRGSWAGAFGLAQFVPSSYVKFGTDGDGDGVVDLFRLTDSAASIANYLKAHGWEPGETEKNRRAVWEYNHCDSYVDAVFAYAGAMKGTGGKPASPVTKKPRRPSRTRPGR